MHRPVPGDTRSVALYYDETWFDYRALWLNHRNRALHRARALANDPPLLLADEPTGNLDSRTGTAVMRRILAAVRERGKSVLCVTHDHRVRELADRVLWIEDGKLAGEPPPSSGGGS